MKLLLTISFLLTTSIQVFSQQQILLIGTKHQTPETELVQLLPVKDAILEFKPDIICTEYRKPTDVESLKYLYGEKHFNKQDSIRKAWNMPAANDMKKLESLLLALKNKNNLFQRMELRNLFYVRSDFGNSEYQEFLIMDQLKSDSLRTNQLRKRFPMFNEMRGKYLWNAQNHDEYNALVFPLARRLAITYLNPIDDQSTNREYERYFEKLSHRDTLFENRRSYYGRVDAFHSKMSSLPLETNTWVYSNSPEMIDDLIYLEAYKLDAGTTSPEVKMLSHYWTLRNKKMASYIDQVAKKNPGKKIVAFFGASHVGPIQEELKKLSKKYSVLTLYDLIN